MKQEPLLDQRTRAPETRSSSLPARLYRPAGAGGLPALELRAAETSPDEKVGYVSGGTQRDHRANPGAARRPRTVTATFTDDKPKPK